MGTDKAALQIGGRSLLARTVAVARGVSRRVCVVGRARPTWWDGQDTGVSWVSDPVEREHSGPLSALPTALEAAQGTDILLLACDMPQLTTEAVSWLIAQTTNNAATHGTIAIGEAEEMEPLFSVYKAEVLPLVHKQLAQGRRSLKGLIAVGKFATVLVPPEFVPALANANTPEEFAALQVMPLD